MKKPPHQEENIPESEDFAEFIDPKKDKKPLSTIAFVLSIFFTLVSVAISFVPINKGLVAAIKTISALIALAFNQHNSKGLKKANPNIEFNPFIITTIADAALIITGFIDILFFFISL